jgi:predicted PurR-regulated permease PerM
MTHPDDTDAPHGHFPHPPSEEAVFLRRLLIGALIVVLLLVLWRVSLVLILTFGGVLAALALRNFSVPLGRVLRVPDRVSVLIATVGIGLVVFGFFDLFGNMASDQFAALVSQIPGAVDSAQAWLNGSVIGRQALSALKGSSAAAGQLLSALPLAGGILGGMGEVILIVVVGIYFAADPHTYVTGTLRLVPPRRRERARQILDAMGESLRKWLIAMTLDMLFLGLMTGIGMWLIGVPLPLALAVLSGVAVFVPYIGPAIATIPGLLLALSVSPRLALYAAIVYLIVLTIEGNISQPMLQRWTVSLPPVVNLLAILVFAPLFGLWGAVLATPLAVALWVLTQKVYIEDVLEDRER